MLFVIALIVILIWIIKECRELHQFAYEGQVKELQSLNPAVIQESLKSKNPLLIHNVPVRTLDLPDILAHNPGYILHDHSKYILLDKFKDEESMAIYRSPKLSEDLGYTRDLLALGKPFETSLTCGSQTSLSLYKGFHTVPMTECVHNVNLVLVVSGTAIMYLVNPKHKTEIQNKSNHAIKKWSHKVVLKPGLLLHIPSNWFSFYECKGSTVIGTYDSDTYPTYLYNRLR
jgi:hypothetical protein